MKQTIGITRQFTFINKFDRSGNHANWAYWKRLPNAMLNEFEMFEKLFYMQIRKKMDIVEHTKNTQKTTLIISAVRCSAGIRLWNIWRWKDIIHCMKYYCNQLHFYLFQWFGNEP